MSFRARTRFILTLAGAMAAASPALAQGKIVFTSDFEQGPLGPQWTSGSLTNSAAFSRFLGRMGNTSVSLSMALDSTKRHQLSFNFYAIDSWDGSDTPWGPDYFGVRMNGADIFRETFSNWNGPQTFNGAAAVSGRNLDFNWHNDSIWNLTMEFTSLSNNVTLQFYAQGLEPLQNESWGLDNIVVREIEEIPAPGGAAVLGAAGAMGLRRRRR